MSRLPPGCRRLAVLVLGLATIGLTDCAAVDFSQPWNPSTPLPQFITHDYVDPANIAAIAKYRSGVGHPFSDNYEFNDRSLKYYFEPLKKYLNTQQSLPLFAPATGTIAAVVPEEQVLSNGDIRGNQVTINPDGFPAFEIRLFHVNLAAGLGAGAHVNAGDPIGYADIRESVDFDMAVGAAWNATQLNPNAGQSSAPPGYRLLSPCDLMNDATFAHFAAYGITDRSDLIVPLAYRNANPGQFGSEDTYNFDPTEYAVFLRAPDIGVQPTGLVLNPGSSGYFSVLAAAQGTSLAYQWYLNSAPISDGSAYSGSTGSVLNFFSAGAAQAGAYTVAVTNPYGTTISDPATLTVLAAPVALPVITSQPVGQTVQAGSNVILSVGATGFGLNYQWTLNNGYISGATTTGPSLTLNSVGAAQAGSYAVIITNPAGLVSSNPAVLNVIVKPPVITIQPTNLTVGPNFSATFSVSASGSGLNFQWLHNGLPVISAGNTVVSSNATSSSLTLFDVSSPITGNFVVTVSNSAGSVTSNAVTLTLVTPIPSSGSGGGGGGAPSLWFLGSLATLAGARFLQVRRPQVLRN